MTEIDAHLAASLSRSFRLIRQLGQGGMGAVFLAEQIAVGNRPVALKVLSRKLLDDPEFLLRFRNEAASTGRIHHPNVVTIYESGQADDGAPYIAMEFLEGESLRQALKRRGALPVPEAAEILQQAARGLNAAHKLGIIHRDLKPDNIFLTYPDDAAAPLAGAHDMGPTAHDVGVGLVPTLPVGIADAGRAQDPPLRPVVVKLVDFGIAKLRESATHTQTGTVLGTPAYMSFEQASGMRSDELDARSDIYSLGVVVYEMLTGRTPFQSDTPVGYLRMHMREDPPPFRAVKPDLPALPQLESVVIKALAKDRDRRYGSVLEFAHAFAEAAKLAPEAVGAVREPPLRDHGTMLHPPATPAATVEPRLNGAESKLQVTLMPDRPNPSRRKWLVIPACFVILLAAATGVFWYSKKPKPGFADTLYVLEHTLTGHDGNVNSVAFSPDGELLASGSDDGTIKLWNVTAGTQSQTLAVSSEAIDSIAISPDGKLLASRSVTPVFGPGLKIREQGREDNAIRFWDLPRGTLRKTLPGHSGKGNSIAFSPDGQLLASSGWGASPDGDILASSVASGSEGVELLDVATGTVRRALPGTNKNFKSGAYEKLVNCVAFSPDGKLLAAGTLDGTINVWDVATGTLRQWSTGTDPVTGRTGTIEAVAFSPDGKALVTGSFVVGIKLWDVATAKLTKTLTTITIHPPIFPSAWSVAFSPDGKLLASGMDDGTIELWDMSTGNPMTTLRGHESIVSCVAFSPNGKLLASGSYDKTIKLWRVAQ